MNLNVDTMNIDELKDILKMLIRLTNDEYERINALQDRVLLLELDKV